MNKPYFQMTLPPRTATCFYCTYYRAEVYRCLKHRKKKITQETQWQITCTDWKDCKEYEGG